MSPLSIRTPLLGALLLSVAASSAAAQSLLQQYGEIVQGSGDAIPGLPGVTLAASAATSIPNMDLNGNIVWRGTMAGTGITTANDQAIFYGRTGNDLQMLLREGDAEPSGTLGGGVTVTYSSTSWDVVRLSPENNYLLINTTLAGTGGTTNDTCVFSGPVGGPLQVLVREGDIAQGGATLSNNLSGALGSSGINSSGICVVRAHVTPGTGDAVSGVNDDGLLYGIAGTPLVWCVREGDPINGGAQVVGTLDAFNFSMDLIGRVLVTQPLSTTLGTAPATTANDMTMMLYTPGAVPPLSLVWREGDPAPDANPPLLEGCDYDTAGSSAQSKVAMSRLTGRVVFTDNLKNGNVTASTNTAIFAGTLGGSFTRIAREGEAAPTGVPGEIYQAIFTSGQPAINENGTVVFVAQLGPTGLDVHQDVAVFLARPPYNASTDVQMILREGQTVTGLPTGWIVDNTAGGGMSSSATTVMLNDRDAVLINVAGVGDNTQPNWGIPATIGWDPQHGTRAFYVQGDTFTVAGNPWPTTSAANWNIFSSGDGCSLQFNNNGDVCTKLFNVSQNAIARCHLGSMISEPASVPITGGVPQNFHIDCGPGLAFNFYIVLATGIGSRPGIPNPLNFGLNVPLNVGGSPDWFTLSFNLTNSVVWGNTLFFTDANGQATANFTMPAGYPMFQGTLLHHAAVLFDFALFSPYVTEPSDLRLY